MPKRVEVASPWKTHSSMPASLRTTLGAWSRHLAGTWLSYMVGGSIMWSSMLTRIMSSICTGGLLSGGGDGQALPPADRRCVGPGGVVQVDLPLGEALEDLVEGDAR